jgi:hypothetical protein
VSRPTTDVTDLLCSADRLLAAPSAGSVDVVLRRGAAFALRAALEAAVSDRLRVGRPQVEVRSMRAKLICLRVCGDDSETARRVQSTWNLLCLGCHYRPYDPGPTEEQLRAWQREVASLVRQLNG